jgi:hypothetical protein
VGTSEDRFDYCGMEQGPQGTVIVRLNVRKAVPSRDDDTRPPSELAQNLLAQLSHPYSPLHTAPVSKTTSDVVVSKPFRTAPLPPLEDEDQELGLIGLTVDVGLLKSETFNVFRHDLAIPADRPSSSVQGPHGHEHVNGQKGAGEDSGELGQETYEEEDRQLG